MQGQTATTAAEGTSTSAPSTTANGSGAASSTVDGMGSNGAVDSAKEGPAAINTSTELLREEHYRVYVPKDGVGSNVGIAGTAANSAAPSPMPAKHEMTQLPPNASTFAAGSTTHPSYFPPYASPPSVQGDSTSRNPVSRTQSTAASTDGIQTPSTNFGYSPAPSDLPQNTSSSIADSQSPDWLPSPVTEEREDELSPVLDKKGSQTTLLPGATTGVRPAGIESHLDDLSLQGITVAPSTRGRTGGPAVSVPTSNKVPPTNGGSGAVRAPSEVSTRSTAPSASLSPSRQGAPPAPATSSRTPSIAGSTTAARPEIGAKKQSVFGKLFHHKDKHQDGHSAPSSGYSTPDPHSRPPLGSRQASHVGQDAGEHAAGGGSHPVRQPSTNGREKDAHAGGFSSFLGRRSSNKKMEKPDPALAAMASAQANRSTASTPDTGTPANASTVTLGAPTTSTTHLTAGVDGAQQSQQVARGVSPSPARQPEAKPMSRRPSSSNANGEQGSHIASGGQPVREKTLKEHLAALGTSAGIGKLNRKTSQTSRRSDDGKSERSHHDDDHPIAVVAGGATNGGSAPKRAPSVGGHSNASTSLTQKYGICEKTAIGKGATAVVRLAHKWDRSTEKLYAVKEFRKRRKNETEKEYVKKLTSEFCISSTLHHINVVETVDLVQNEEKHWCEVMEYCPGGDLYTAIKKGDMSTEQMNIFFKQIITGVAYLHSMGVAHRDIKPENLLLDNQGHVKITDFGVSDVFRMCWEKQTHMSKGLCGSEPYIAPEQFEQKEYDARLVDVWACAVVFYCMQAQELPWRVAKPTDPSFQSYIHHYPNSPAPPPLGNLHPKDCRTVIKKMLDPNPKTRIGMDQVLADPWMKSIVYEVAPTANGAAPFA